MASQGNAPGINNRGRHKRLTDLGVRELRRAPKGKRTDHYDSEARGLHVRVNDKGRRTWCYVGRKAGDARQYRFVLGEAPDKEAFRKDPATGRDVLDPSLKHEGQLSVDEARGLARAYRARLRAGEDPRDDLRRKLQDRKTFAFETQLESYLAAHVRKLRSGAERERIFKRDVLPSWTGRSVREIGKGDVARLVRGIATGEGRKVEGEAGPFKPAPYMANRALSYLRAFFRWLVGQNQIDRDPSEGLKGGAKEVKRRVALSDGELKAVYLAAEGLGYPFGAFVRALILTGQRRGEVAGMRWSEIDLEAKVWLLPAARMKAGLEHLVPLSDPMLELLAAAPRFDGCDYVFAGEPRKVTHKEGVPSVVRPAIAGFSDGKEKLAKAIAIPMPDWTLHDLRRTFSTGCAGLRIQESHTEAVLAHAVPGQAGTYNVHKYKDEKRAALTTWARHVMALAHPPESNVVKLEARG